MKKKLLIVGAKGSGEIATSVFEDINKQKEEWDIIGYLNDVFNPGEYLGKYKVIGSSQEILDYVNRGYYIHYTFHFNVKNKKNRVNNLKELELPSEALATGIHPLAYLNPFSTIGNGSLMLPYSSTSAKAEIGDFCHLYTGSFLGHDSKLNDYSTMAAHSVIGARIKTGIGVHIGLNTCIRENIKIGNYAIIGMGSTVISDVSDNEIHVGNPSKNIKN